MKLDHLVILLSDLEANLPFYETLLPLLGFEKTRDHVWGNEEGSYLDFRQAREPEHGYHRHAPGLNHLGFAAPDRAAIERIAAAMSAAGFEVPAIQEFPDGSAIFFKDADGMRVEVGA
jgi:lactoylglutathione lyase